jgi:hypothetical protein
MYEAKRAGRATSRYEDLVARMPGRRPARGWLRLLRRRRAG